MGNKLHKADQKGAAEVDFRSQYRLGRKLGEGAFGVVHECKKRDAKEDGKDSSTFAVKMIDRVEADTGDIEREVRVMGALDHPNVVKCLDIFVEKCFVCIVMPKYGGGDLVDGLQLHLRKYGKIPEHTAAHLCSQMFSAIAHIHSKGYIHRDVKGDNLLMDRPDLSEPGVHVVLSDFGTAIPHQQGKVLRQLTGTRVFWSPEFCQRRYSYPADVWACGVVMYGLVDATFPFRDEKQIMERQPKMPARISAECKELLTRILDKEPERRINLAEVMEHPWLKNAKPVAQQGAAQPEAQKPAADEEAVAREQVPQAMALRRREMASKYEANSAAKIQKLEIKDFAVDGLHAGEQIHYKWFSQQEAGKLYEVSGVDNSGNKTAKQFAWTPKSLKTHLEKANIKTDVFGTGKAKTLQELCQEITDGKCSLMHDCSGDFSSAKTVRVVEVVLLRIKSGKDNILIEAKEKYADGREHETWRLPGAKQRPNENVKATAERIMTQLLKLEKNKVSLNFNDKEILEEKEDSPSYPGVVTVYRKHIVPGQLQNMVMKPAELEAVGGAKMNPFVTEDANMVKTWNWLSSSQVNKKQIKVLGVKATEAGPSALVATNAAIDEDGLKNMLEENKVDVAKFGLEGAKTIHEFAQEIARGESHLQAADSGVGLVRVVDVVLLKVEDEATGKVLLETARTNEKSGAKKSKDQLPGAKSRPNENIYSTAKRISNCLLNINDELLTFGQHTLIEEDHDSPSYPGIRTTYRKHIISAIIEKGISQ